MATPQRHSVELRRPRVEHLVYVIDAGLIRRGRKMRDWSQYQLGVLVGMQQNSVHLVETGRQKQVPENAAVKLTKELSLSWEAAFSDTPPVPMSPGENGSQPIDTVNTQCDDDLDERTAS